MVSLGCFSNRLQYMSTYSLIGTFLLLCSIRESATFCPVRIPTQHSNHPSYHHHLSHVASRPRANLHAHSSLSARPITFLGAKKTSGKDDDNDEEDDDEDIPEDWSEDDVLAEFSDVEISTDDDDDTDAVVVDDDDAVVAKVVDEEYDEDEDDDIIDEIDLDEDEDDEGDLVDEFEAEYDDEEYEYVPAVDEDEDEDDDEYEELEDDEEDPGYMKQKELAEIAAQKAYERASDEAFDPLDFMMNEMTDEQKKTIEQSDLFQRVQERMKGIELTEVDVGSLDLETAVEEVPDIMEVDPYPRHEEGEVNVIKGPTGLTDDEMDEFDKAYKRSMETINEEPWDKVMLKDLTGWEKLSNETIEEMEDCLEEIGGSAYNVSKWLLYDLDFNVSNLILSAVKHNREAPILFQHWYPQLVTYKRYQHARDRDFDFTWNDVEAADMSELQRYYAGFGYDEIPQKAPAETGIISLEDLDEEEIKMAAFDTWMKDVYNPELDRKDFDDDDMQDEDNVFSKFYEAPQHPDKPTFEESLEDIEMWKEEMGDDESNRAYRDMMGQAYEYEVVEDEEFQREFRGHLTIACTGNDSDLEIAEKITLRFEKEFGKKVFVETRILQIAREDDSVFEVWLESYEVDLLHSKKRATSSAKGWFGPAECDDNQIEFLVDRVGFLISDDARYSYRMEDAEMVE